MKVSLNWVKKFTDVSLPVDELVTKIGEQLGAVEEVIDIGKRYKGVYAVKVIECIKHPNADKLHVCLIDDGGVVKKVARKGKLVEVVCGAPNVKAGLTVAWIPPGATVPSTFDKDAFILEARELRGVVSNGMLASASELALGDDHSGLIILDDKLKPGTPIAEALELDDYVIDIENKMFTHRPDLFGILGVAREIAGIQNKAFKSPDWYREDADILADGRKNVLNLEIKNQVPKLVPRFCAVAIKDVRVQNSPAWLRARLASVGIRPINNIVDVTNFLMHETAQPLHAYDYDKVKTGILGARVSKKGEELKLLGGKTIKLDDETVVITDGSRPIGLAGVMGGADTEVDDNTKNIILEVANFDMNQIRKTAMAYGLFTDASTRFTKNQSPRQNRAVIVKAIDAVKALAGGRVASRIVDNNHVSIKKTEVEVTADFINERLGELLSASQIKKILENVEFKVKASGNKLKIEAPFWRTDIEIPEDIVEEVGRLYGYDKLPQTLPKKDLAPAQSDALISFKTQIRDILARAGANEVLTYSFVNERLLTSAGQDLKNSYHIKNALSPDLQYYRQSLSPSLLAKVEANSRAGFDKYLIYEIGVTHQRGLTGKDGLPIEFNRLSLVYAATNKDQARAYYQVKRFVDYVLTEQLGIELDYQPLANARLSSEGQSAASTFLPEQSAAIYSKEEPLGIIGLPNKTLKQVLKLPSQIAQAEFDLTTIFELAKARIDYKPLNRFPDIEQDITLRASVGLSYQQLTNFIKNFLTDASKNHGYNFSLRPLDIYQKPEDTAHKQTTWRINFTHPERTLTTEEVNKLLDELAKSAKQKLKAERI